MGKPNRQTVLLLAAGILAVVFARLFRGAKYGNL